MKTSSTKKKSGRSTFKNTPQWWIRARLRWHSDATSLSKCNNHIHVTTLPGSERHSSSHSSTYWEKTSHPNPVRLKIATIFFTFFDSDPQRAGDGESPCRQCRLVWHHLRRPFCCLNPCWWVNLIATCYFSVFVNIFSHFVGRSRSFRYSKPCSQCQVANTFSFSW